MRARRQRGLLLPAFALLLMLGAIGLGVSLYHRASSTQIQTRAETAQSLAKAKALLRRYAQSYQYTHTDNPIPGYMLCPDQDGDGSAELSCDGAGGLSVGLFPYRTMGTPPLRDGSGECLWYAVSGAYKNSPTPAGGRMNWDALGQLSVQTPDGRPAFPINRPLDRAVAVVIAAGPALPGQTRPARNGAPCIRPGTSSSVVAAYLESDFSTPNSAQVTVLDARASDTSFNDQTAWLTPAELFDGAFLRRSDFATGVIGALLNVSVLNLSAPPTTMLPPPDDPVRIGNVEIGAIPLTLVPNPASREAKLLKHWHSQFVYLRCIESASSTCLRTARGDICRGMLLFSGQASTAQDRTSGLADDFFESNTQALTDPEDQMFVGNAVFDPARPYEDLAICL